MFAMLQGRPVYIRRGSGLRSENKVVIREYCYSDERMWGPYYGIKGEWVESVRYARRFATVLEAVEFCARGGGPKRTYAEVCAAKIEGWS